MESLLRHGGTPHGYTVPSAPYRPQGGLESEGKALKRAMYNKDPELEDATSMVDSRTEGGNMRSYREIGKRE